MRFLLGIGLGVLAVLLGLEGLCHVLPVSSGLRMATSDKELPVAHYLPSQPYVYSHGWSFMNARQGKTNAQGFANSPDFEPGAAAMVLGDSYMESLMHDLRYTVQGQLGAALGGKVVAAACSGNRLPDILELARRYVPQVKPRVLVVFMKIDEVALLSQETPRGHGGFVVTDDGHVSLVHNDYEEAGSKTRINRFALTRYVYYNLKLPGWISANVHLRKPVQTGPAWPHADFPHKLDMLRFFFSELKTLADANGTKVIFLADGDRRAIYAGKLARVEASAIHAADRKTFFRMAAEYGNEIVDMQPIFTRQWIEHHERLDFLPSDGHWNRTAHRLATEALLPHIPR